MWGCRRNKSSVWKSNHCGFVEEICQRNQVNLLLLEEYLKWRLMNGSCKAQSGVKCTHSSHMIILCCQCFCQLQVEVASPQPCLTGETTTIDDISGQDHVNNIGDMLQSKQQQEFLHKQQERKKLLCILLTLTLLFPYSEFCSWAFDTIPSACRRRKLNPLSQSLLHRGNGANQEVTAAK